MSRAVVYTRSSCPWCVKAKELLTAQGISFVEHVIGSPEFADKESLQAKLGRPVNTVPQIVLDGAYVGGYTDLAAKLGAA
ncbi:glutaredoxin [Xanthomonas phage Xoo-sp13]|nr:glutaredoxin [Xanthomonas phage Xoo-sp13]